MISAKFKKEEYRRLLKKEGALSLSVVDKLLGLFKQRYMTKGELSKDLMGSEQFGPRITSLLTNLKLHVVKGNRSWEGLVIGFPGSKEQLSTEYVGTPYIREILYPILDLYERICKKKKTRLPCLYLLGERFSDVFLRKFRLLNAIIPHVIILTADLMECANRASKKIIENESKITEKWIQTRLCEKMGNLGGLGIPTRDGPIKTGFIAYEVPTFEGTLNPERLDILGYNKRDHSLIAFEIKGPGCGRVQLENLFLQGMEHRNWLEENKMAVKFIFEGPKGKAINTKKRVRLMLGFCGKKIPHLFLGLREQAIKKDPHLKIDFCRFMSPSAVTGELNLARF